MQLQPNITFDNHYTLIRQLGRGGFSEVWLAHDSYMDLDVALKIYAPGQGMDAHSIDELRREIKVVFTLNHPNLLTPKYLGVWKGMPYLVLAYCSRGSLTQQIGKLSEQELWHVLHDVAAGLAYLHKNDIVHQDIKPDNILLDESGNYVITDFGISTKARSTLRKSVIGGAVSGGTMAYMGPERFSKQPAPTKANDIWSLGAMMFELVTGNVPFGEHGGVIQKSGAEIPEITENVASALKGIIEQMLALNTWDRPTAEQLAEDKKKNSISSPSRPTQLFGRTPSDATDVNKVWSTLPQKKTNRNRKWWLLSIVALLLIGIFFILEKSPNNVTFVVGSQQEVIDSSLVELIDNGIHNGSIWAEVDIIDKDNLKIGESCKVKVKTSCDMMFLKVRGADAENTVVGEMVKTYGDLNVGHIKEWEEIWKPNAELLEIDVYLWTEEGEYPVDGFRFDVAPKEQLYSNASKTGNIRSGLCGNNLKWSFDPIGGVLTISGAGRMSEWPHKEDVPWFKNRGNIKQVILKDGITSISSCAFFGCSSLKSFNIPKTVDSIGGMAFCRCSKLSSITIPEGVTKIDPWMFLECKSLKQVTLPNNLKNIYDGAFADCSSLKSITLPNSLDKIYSGAFSGCSSLISVTIPKNVMWIGGRAFSGCTSLQEITYPADLDMSHVDVSPSTKLVPYER